MFNNLLPLSSSLSFGKIIGGLSKTLAVANKIIPLYIKAKPIMANAKNTLGIIREMTSKMASINKLEVKEEIKKENLPILEDKVIIKEDSQPTFFL